ncbi:hypothetical protein SAMN06265370_12437 [Puniceibacterium sediminis]|uniref:Uncharacterized protein n=1 Tax=Puniceibacterium sediminis TaxID=1608407 RepID=A0A238Z584_9RHOB|nr:hypothetical protein SAMN06265370_12437 [Puniceibacterium sediminis]
MTPCCAAASRLGAHITDIQQRSERPQRYKRVRKARLNFEIVDVASALIAGATPVYSGNFMSL